ncbi:M23 family metallopeptidase [Kocuria rosea]|uniref:M23 family metallopeptidase n=1 Tax=Kocuria rosea TaxID=1275 RepID=UPI0025B77DE0|nr:peptidoglycan DD-metalloendopeptidase family protein [Kocuria rosea]WJZ66363.1 peptidoglycan DD-metalloendopeptidase family protein [Kocuria rosea]
MPRDSSRRPARPALRHRASSPVTALTAFSALVAVSVAVSSGISPDTGQGRGSAFGAPAASAERTEQRDSGWSLLAAGQERTAPPAGPLRDERTTSPVRDGGAGQGSWRAGAGRGDGGRESASTVRPGRQAPKLYQGELPVNTIIAPARPGAVLPGGQFGWRIAPDRGGREFHNGTDVSAAAGLPVVAALDGVVTAVFWDVWGGNRVEVTHADGIRTTYNHLEDVRVRTGDRLAASEQLGTVGATGIRVTGPHLHFETWVDGQAVDPQSFDWVDGMRVIPASRSKYSLEVPVPDTVEDPAAQQAEAAKKADAVKKAEAAKKAAAQKKAAQQKATEQKAAAQKKPLKKPQPTTEPSAPVKPDPTTAPASPPGQKPTTAPAKPVKPAQPAPTPTTSTPSPSPAKPTPAKPSTDAGEDQELLPGVAPRVPDTKRDTDRDGTLDVEDTDLDGDGTDNEEDDNLDGDKFRNEVDPDMDGDGLVNEEDPDIDGDGIPNDKDEEPRRPARIVASTPKPETGEPADPADTADPAGKPGATGISPVTGAVPAP